MYIYILDYDTHYLINYDNPNIDNLDAFPGASLTSEDNVTSDPGLLLPANIDAGTRSVYLCPYTDKFGDDDESDPWTKLDALSYEKTGDGSYSYCFSDEVYASLGIQRAKVVMMWCYNYTQADDKYITNDASWCGLWGTLNGFTYNFYGLDFQINKVDDLGNSTFKIVSGFFQNGGNYLWRGCIIEDLKIGENKTIFGGYVDANASYVFSKLNFFENDTSVTGSPIINKVTNLNIYIDPNDYSWAANSIGYSLLTNNALDFFQRASLYSSQSATIISTPSKRYAYINPSYAIVSGT